MTGVPPLSRPVSARFFFSVFSCFSVWSAFHVSFASLDCYVSNYHFFFLVVVCRSRRKTWHVFLCVCACISKQRTTVALIKEERRTTWFSWSSAIFPFLSLSSKSRRVPPRKFSFFFFSFASTTTMLPQYRLVKAMTFGINTQGNMADFRSCTDPFIFLPFPSRLRLSLTWHSSDSWQAPRWNTSDPVWLSGIDNLTTRLSLAKFTGTKFEARCMISSIMRLHDYTNENWNSLRPSIITWQLHVTTACRFPRSFLTWSLCTGSKVSARGISGAENNSLKFFLTDLTSVATAPGIFTNWLYHSTLCVPLDKCLAMFFGGQQIFYCLILKRTAKSIPYVWKRATKFRNLHCWEKRSRNMPGWDSSLRVLTSAAWVHLGVRCNCRNKPRLTKHAHNAFS